MVNEVAAFLEQIHGSATQAAGLVQEITAATKEQTASIGQVTLAVGELDKVTQVNSASAEESSASSEQLLAQARAMNTMVDRLGRIVNGETKPTSDGAPRLKRKKSKKADSQASAEHRVSVPMVKPTVIAENYGSRPSKTTAEQVIPLDLDESDFQGF